MLIIKDDFFREPHRVRAIGLEMIARARNTPNPKVGSYRSPEAVRLAEAIPGIFPRDAASAGGLRLSHGVFRFLGAGQRKRYIHYDDDVAWSGVAFLGENRGFYPAISFYRHKRTGLGRYEPDAARVRTRGSSAGSRIKAARGSFRPASMKSERDDRDDPREWEKLMTIPVRFNRLILFDARLFHKNISRWSVASEDGRLAYNFAYDYA